MKASRKPQFVIYNASAGSGKTFTLVRNYIADLLTGKRNFRNILAITFTNKAVAEMKERIIDTLKGMSTSPLPSAYIAIFKEIKIKTGLPTNEIQSRSAQILNTILHNYAGFEISTIDSFTHRILQIFAKDLNIPANFEVQLEQDEILGEAVDLLISRAGSDIELTEALIDFALTKTDEDRSWDITKDLNDIAKLILNENNFKPLDQLREKDLKDFKAFQKQLRKRIQKLKKERRIAGQAFFKLLNQNQLEESDFYHYTITHFSRIAAGDWKKEGHPKWAEDIVNTPPYKKSTAEDRKKTINEISREIADLQQQSENCYYQVEFCKRILKRLSSTSLLSAIEKEVNQIKEERGLLLISEFNKKISKSIKGEPAPFIYERLGERFTTFYIDEFQDTSVLQWENLKPLIAESLSAENGCLTLIGDAKQSIYRWRGGRAEQFMALSAGENPFFVNQYIENLPKNYRSSETIVNFNNDFFDYSARFLHSEAYRRLFNHARQEPAVHKKGLVDIRFIDTANREEEDEIYPEQVYAIIEELSNKYPKDYPLYRDICILVRKKAEAVAIANYLTEKEIPIISSESLLVKNSLVVSFLINLMDFSIRSHDKALKFEILDFLYEQDPPADSSFAFIHSRLDRNGSSFFSTLQEEYDFNLQKFEQLPLYDAVEYSLRQFHLIQEVDAYVQFFLDFIYEYTQRHIGGISEFLEYWKLKKEKLAIVTPEGNNAVQILTVHKAKGLEFPIVIYPYAHTRIDDTQKDNIWIPMAEGDKIPMVNTTVSSDFLYYGEIPKALYQRLLTEKEMDAINVLYVALTRPKEQLYILTKRETPNQKSGTYPNTYASWFQTFLQHQKIWKEEKTQYRFGRLPIPQSPPPSATSSKTINSFISSAPEEHQITIVTKSGELWDSEQEAAIERGNLIHQLLTTIKTTSDIPLTLQHGLSSGSIAKEEQKQLQSILQKIVLHDRLMPYFSDQYTIYTEKEILTHGQFKRLDRLCIKENKAVIIDYKTGDPNPSHSLQIEDYAKAIKSFGYTIEYKFLVYISEEIKVRQVK